MWIRGTVMLLGLLAAAGCASEPTRDWMKLSGQYTAEDYRRDLAACTRSGKLDHVCMRERGWVDVARPAEKPQEVAPDRRGGSPTPARRVY